MFYKIVWCHNQIAANLSFRISSVHTQFPTITFDEFVIVSIIGMFYKQPISAHECSFILFNMNFKGIITINTPPNKNTYVAQQTNNNK